MKHFSTKAIGSVIAEMNRQDKKWGADRNQHPFVWQTILSEEVGEFSQAILHDEFGGPKSGTAREEMVQVAAVTLQIIEYYDRHCAPAAESEQVQPVFTLPDIPAGREKISGCDWLDWNQLSALGLILRINAEILHPLGLAIFRDPAYGTSAGAMIAPDGKWEYAPDVIEKLRVRLSDYSGKHGHF
ncbi:MazG-like family protein [Klebsiella michiganensis]|uniref:MazG-like family protein n=1 Tax=Klebsiella michiganensis TaxID=1134687 RepID=UPI002659B1B5|nr:MazG-like family protein [Klebsiella michiganensis]WKK00624.1 MazG-like family protein [Klebsiella michiganensis]WKK03166.1 MazG-like family protein [Klebsiella michiganensis]